MFEIFRDATGDVREILQASRLISVGSGQRVSAWVAIVHLRPWLKSENEKEKLAADFRGTQRAPNPM